MEKQAMYHGYPVPDLDALRSVDWRTVDRESLPDARDIQVNPDLPTPERILDYIQRIGNPYTYRYGDYVVHVQYSDDSGLTLMDCLRMLISTKTS